MTKNELQNIVRSGTIVDKANLAETLGALYLGPDGAPNDRELALFFDIVRYIIHDVETRVRRALSERMAERKDIPHDLILTLAKDVIEVASPVLIQSPVLQDGDLIDLVLERTTDYRQAIAGRYSLSEAVSQSIVSTSDIAAISTLLKNENAFVGAPAFARLIDESTTETDYQELLIARHDLPEDLANQLYQMISEALRNDMPETLPGTMGPLDYSIADAVERAIREDPDYQAPAFNTPDAKISDLPAALVHALETEDILRFEDLFQQATELTASDTARAIYDMGTEGLAIACKAIGMDAVAFGKVFCRLRGRRPFTAFRKSPQFAKGTAFFDSLDKNYALRLLDEWRSSMGESSPA